MSKTALAVVILTVLSLSPAIPAEEGKRTLSGEYVWNQRGSSGDLEAVFTPTGEETWDVDFHFTFRGKPHTYTGIAEGDLSVGDLRGTVKNESRKRTFTFEGKFKKGKFRGTHAEIEGDREVQTGTLTLK